MSKTKKKTTKTKTITADVEYSRAWRERYGRSLTPDEIRLVQGFRGVDTDDQAGLLQLVTALVLGRVVRRDREAARTWKQSMGRAARRLPGDKPRPIGGARSSRPVASHR